MSRTRKSCRSRCIRQFTDDGVVPLRVRRDGARASMTLRVVGDRRALTEPGKLLPGLGFDLTTWNADTMVQDVPAGSAGARAGCAPAIGCWPWTASRSRNGTEFISMVSGAPGRDISIEVRARGRSDCESWRPVPG